MNLFATSDCPILSAQALDDSRVGKLLIEANQMMSLAIKDFPAIQPTDFGPGRLCQGKAYFNHPVSQWVRATTGNYIWTILHAKALSNEFIIRFNKMHQSAYRTFYLQPFGHLLPLGELQPFQNSAANTRLGISYKHITPTTQAYRDYLNARWASAPTIPKWTNRKPPTWANY